MIDVDDRPLRVFLVGIWEENQPGALASLNELEALSGNLGWEFAGHDLVKLRQRTPDLLIGSGKAAELVAKSHELEADIIAFDVELSPTHQRNWEKLSGLAVADRPGIIIDIFADRAQTREAKLQVELAELEYQLPRLASSYTGLSRQRGGAFGTRGAGETKIELDRRVIKNRMAVLRQELGEVAKQRDVLRKQRKQHGVPVISLVGYTNAGKSRLHRALTGSDVLVKDALFATLDPTARKLVLPEGTETILVDTVGFVRNLPHRLIEAFKATLEEVRQSDLLIQVLDASDPQVFAHHTTTMSVLGEIGAGNKTMLLALNKSDLVESEEQAANLRFRFAGSTQISALKGTGLPELLEQCEKQVQVPLDAWDILVPWERGEILAALHRETRVLEQKQGETGTEIVAVMDERVHAQLEKAGIQVSKHQ